MGSKRLTWLHISDIHIKAGDPYDRDVVLNALVQSMQRFKTRGIIADLVFFTGDVAYSGKKIEYERATPFFERLLKELELSKEALFIIPGNHDVDRSRGSALKRTLDSKADSNEYFRQGSPLLHISERQADFISWHDEFFSGYRLMAKDTTCGPYINTSIRNFTIGIIPINTSIFCLDDADKGKLWIGRRCLEAVFTPSPVKPDLTVALLHHPLDWLNEIERSQITSLLNKNVDCILRGHLHETEIFQTDGNLGATVHLAAGASYQGSDWPNNEMAGFVRTPFRFL